MVLWLLLLQLLLQTFQIRSTGPTLTDWLTGLPTNCASKRVSSTNENGCCCFSCCFSSVSARVFKLKQIDTIELVNECKSEWERVSESVNYLPLHRAPLLLWQLLLLLLLSLISRQLQMRIQEYWMNEWMKLCVCVCLCEQKWLLLQQV